MPNRQLDEEAIFHIARRIQDLAVRADYLEQACGDSTALLARVQALLDVHEQEQDFLKSRPSAPEPTQDAEPITEAPGTEIGRYRLMEQIGEGGMGVVFVAEQRQPLKRKVALKVIKPGMDSKAVTARFEAERQALALMDHHNIAKVLDAGATAAGRPYFVMEYVRGIPITDYCDQNKLTIRERLDLFIQVCQAIQHAHQKGIVHRDIKPSNVLVTLHDGKPVPKVIDFGVAKALNTRLTDRTIYTAHMQIIGTMMYMSPEQAELSGLDIDTRSDVYSLGVLLYELLTGTTPFQKAELDQAGFDEQRRMIRESEPPRASVRISSLRETATTIAEHRKTDTRKLRQQVCGDLDWIVMKALEKDRTRRYETAIGFAVDVERFLNDDAIEARPPSNVYRLKKAARRHRVALATTALVMLTLLAGTVMSMWQRSIAVAEAARATEEERKARDAERGAVEAKEEADTRRREAETALDFVRDYTMLLAMTGDPKDLSLAKRIAEAAGTKEPWPMLLEARSAMHRGDSDQATEILQKASGSFPDNLACRGMLLYIQAWSGSEDGMGKRLLDFRVELESRDTLTFQEMLFGGEALLLEPRAGLKWLDQCLELRDSLLVRLTRASMVTRQCIEYSSTDRLDEAVDDARLALERFPESPFVLGESLKVFTLAMQAYRNQTQPFEYLRPHAERALRKLQEFPECKAGKLWIAWYLDCFGDPSVAEAAWYDVLENGLEGWHKAHAATVLIDRKTERDVETLLRGTTVLEQFALVAALYHQGNESKARQVCCRQPRLGVPVEFVFGTYIDFLLVIGPASDVRVEAKRLLNTPGQKYTTDFDRDMIEYLAGSVPFEDLLARCVDNSERSMARFAAARLQIHEGDWEEAEEHLLAADRLGVVHVLDYYWAKAYLRKYGDRFKD